MKPAISLFFMVLIALLALSSLCLAQNVSINLEPINPPIQIPGPGGSFDYNVTVSNTGSSSQTFDAWIMVQLPSGSWYGPVLGPVSLTLPAGASISRQRTQPVPGSAPEGTYVYEGRVGVYPNIVLNSDSFTFAKTLEGGQLWIARYNGPGNNDDQPYSMAVDLVGNVYVAGKINGTGRDPYDYGTIKYDSDGNQTWIAFYGGLGNDEAYALALDADENVYITGRSEGMGTNYDYATIKYDSNGDQLWVARYNGPGNYYDCPFSVAVDSAENVYVTGYSCFNLINADYVSIKYDAEGHQVWTASYNGPGDYIDNAFALVIDGLNNVYVTGRSMGIGTFLDYATVKYDANGSQVWIARYNGPGNGDDEAQSLAVDGAGNVYVTGRIYLGGNYYRYATIKYDSNGNQLWIVTHFAPSSESAPVPCLALDPAGNVYVTYYSCTIEINGPDFVTIKYDTNGHQLWLARYSGPPGMTSDTPYGISLDNTGNVYVTGSSWGYSSMTGIAIKYDGNGNQIWLASNHDLGDPCAIALDPAANVYVTGRDCGDYVTIKYAGGNPAGAGPDWQPVEPLVFGAQEAVTEYRLNSCYPNPFNAATALSYELRAASYVSLRVYDSAGRLVTTLVDGWRAAGTHELTFDASALPSGMYFCRLVAGEFNDVQKMVLIK